MFVKQHFIPIIMIQFLTILPSEILIVSIDIIVAILLVIFIVANIRKKRREKDLDQKMQNAEKAFVEKEIDTLIHNLGIGNREDADTFVAFFKRNPYVGKEILKKRLEPYTGKFSSWEYSFSLAEDILEYEKYDNKLRKKFGDPDIIIPYHPLYEDPEFARDAKDEFRAYSNSHIIILGGEVYDLNKFQSVTGEKSKLRFSVDSEDNTIKSITNTQTNLGSIAGRAIVGGLLLGTTGAIIGGLTASTKSSTTIVDNTSRNASKKTEYDTYNLKLYYKYDEKASKPYISIDCGVAFSEDNMKKIKEVIDSMLS